jgi:hypothetical protein
VIFTRHGNRELHRARGKSRRDWILAALAVTQLGCTMHNYGSSIAIDRFSQSQTCPKERIAARQVPLSPGDFALGAPPADIASDPGRLALWSKNASADLAHYHDITTVEASGCGARQTYLCWRENWRTMGDWQSTCDAVDLNNPRAALEAIPLSDAARASLSGRLAASLAVAP